MAELDEPCRIRGVQFLTLGSFPRAVAQDLVARVSTEVAVPCQLLRPSEQVPIPHLARRNQVDADRMLQVLEDLDHDPEEILVGVTLLDLGNPIFSFFFGRARQDGGAALVSLARLDPTFYGLPEDRDLMLRRGVLEVVHELGHIGGLHHCDDWNCVMHFAATVEAIDNRGPSVCPRCREELPHALRSPSRERDLPGY
ncbi:MAG: archaemetzincin family Zn-dependent metalloprotease [Planctomycetota bacterium]|jgi:archaemetzincin